MNLRPRTRLVAKIFQNQFKAKFLEIWFCSDKFQENSMEEKVIVSLKSLFFEI